MNYFFEVENKHILVGIQYSEDGSCSNYLFPVDFLSVYKWFFPNFYCEISSSCFAKIKIFKESCYQDEMLS